MTPVEIARARVIQTIDIVNGKGWLKAGGTLYQLDFDDLLDLERAAELLMLKLTGKVLSSQFRPVVYNRGALKFAKLIAGDYSLYTGGDAPCPPKQVCTVTDDELTTHYLRIEVRGMVWENWFCRLDELVKILTNVIREAQEDALPKGGTVIESRRAPKRTHQVGAVDG